MPNRLPPAPLAASIRISLAVLFVALCFGPPAAQASLPGFRVVVHPENPVLALPAEELSDVFLGKNETWPDGRAIRVVEREPDSPLRSAFTHVVHDRSVQSVTQLWQRRVLTGRAQAPRRAASDAEVLEMVAADPTAIGYVADSTPIADLREVAVVDLPRRIDYQAPRYTETARRARVDDIVLLRVTVDEGGAVSDVGVVKDLPLGLTREAVRAVRAWRYEPTEVEGRGVSVSFDVAVRFTLGDQVASR